MDRLDTWLSAQRSWRLLLVRCVALVPLGLAAGSLWSFRVTFDPATPQVRALAARLALCVAASLALAALNLLPLAWPTWRLIAGLYSFAACFVVTAYEDAEPLAWRWHRGWVYPLQLALTGVYLVMVAWNVLYLRRLRRLREHWADPNT